MTEDLATLPLFALPPLSHPELPREATLQERFRAFNEANPQVYAEIERRALRAARNGARRIGVKAIVETLRWSALETHGDEYKINNSFAAFYSRELVDRRPELRGLIELRESVADKAEVAQP